MPCRDSVWSALKHMSKKVLITSRSFGKLSDAPLAVLKNAGFQVDSMGSGFDMARFAEVLPEYDALIIGAHDLPAELLTRCPRLKIICKHGVGLDNIPLEKAHELGITVTNTPGTNSQAVADLAFGLMLDTARYISLSASLLKQGIHRQTVGVDVNGKVLGILGFGRIGQAVARRARGFDMQVYAYDPYLSRPPEDLSAVVMADAETVLRKSDFVSLHLPLTGETRGFMNEERFAMMKDGAILINTARGAVVKEEALLDALTGGKLRAAGLDVTEEEPTRSDNPLLGLENVVITDHIGMYSKEATSAVSLLCAEAVRDFFAGRTPKNTV